MSQSLLAGLIVMVLGAAAERNIAVVPLGESSDPVTIASATIDLAESGQPAIVVELQNNTNQPLSTSQIWLSSSRFFTRAEADANRNRMVSTCGRLGSATIDRPETVASGGLVSVRLSVAPCEIDLRHTHFYVYVQRVTATRRFSSPVWERDPEEFARMLAAAPHD